MFEAKQIRDFPLWTFAETHRSRNLQWIPRINARKDTLHPSQNLRTERQRTSN